MTKVLMLNTSDTMGGAARAAYRLHKALQATSVESQMLVQSKFGDDNTVIGPVGKVRIGFAKLRPTLDASFVKAFGHGATSIFTPAWLPLSNIARQVNKLEPDIVHLHWIGSGFLRIEELKLIKAPVVWTLHDMWPFTGGCHYDRECGKYIDNCGNCPQLLKNGERDLSRKVFDRKKRAWCKLDITIVTPSHWLGRCARDSRLFGENRIEIIHNGLDLDLFSSVDKSVARTIWRLPKDKQFILFGAMNATSDVRKGFDLLVEGIKVGRNLWTDNIELVIFGASEPKGSYDFGLPVHFVGQLYDDVSLAVLFSAVDVLVAPSRQDNLPNVITESLACGIPTVAFETGGMSDLINHKVNGYLAKPFDPKDLARGLHWVLSSTQNCYNDLRKKSRELAQEKFDQVDVAKQYMDLYQSILET